MTILRCKDTLLRKYAHNSEIYRGSEGRPCLDSKNFGKKIHVAFFVVNWQNLSNYELTNLKRFVSTFYRQIVQLVIFYLHLMLYESV
jgi:hypothetical protein